MPNVSAYWYITLKKVVKKEQPETTRIIILAQFLSILNRTHREYETQFLRYYSIILSWVSNPQKLTTPTDNNPYEFNMLNPCPIVLISTREFLRRICFLFLKANFNNIYKLKHKIRLFERFWNSPQLFKLKHYFYTAFNYFED